MDEVEKLRAKIGRRVSILDLLHEAADNGDGAACGILFQHEEQLKAMLEESVGRLHFMQAERHLREWTKPLTVADFSTVKKEWI